MSSGILGPPNADVATPLATPNCCSQKRPWQSQNKNHKKSHTIRGLPEKPYSSLTGRPSKTQIILSYNNGANRKQQHGASAIGHVQYHNFIYNNHNSHNTIATLILTMVTFTSMMQRRFLARNRISSLWRDWRGLTYNLISNMARKIKL